MSLKYDQSEHLDYPISIIMGIFSIICECQCINFFNESEIKEMIRGIMIDVIQDSINYYLPNSEPEKEKSTIEWIPSSSVEK